MSTSKPLSPMGQAALQYARHGWPVFPCRERDQVTRNAAGRERTFKAKAPYTGSGLKDATCDEQRVVAWWREYPDALIGLPMGVNGCFALDFDPRREEVADEGTGELTVREWTLEQLRADLEAQMGCPLPRSVTAMTQSGGVHVWYRQPAEGDPIRNRGNLPEHVDVRGQGGYVIAAPSVTFGADGEEAGRYRWLRDRGDWRDPADMAEAPAALVEILRSRKAKPSLDRQRDPASPAAIGAAVGDDVRKYALAAVEGECRDVRSAGTGKRNAQLNESAFKVATLVAAGAVDVGFARACIEAAARDNPGQDDERQLLATLDSGWTAGLQQPRDLAEIAAASRARRERGPPRSRSAPPAPGGTTDGKPSSQPGGTAVESRYGGRGNDRDARVMRECAFLPHTDLGNLERFLKRHGRDFLFVEQWGWLAWDGKRWNRDMAVSLLGRAVQDTMRAIQDEASLIRDSGCPVPANMFDALTAEELKAHEKAQVDKLDRIISIKRSVVTHLSDTIAKWGRTSEGAGHIKCIAGMAEARLAVRTEAFDNNPLAVNVDNGTLVFHRPEDGRPASVELRPHRRRDLMTKLATARYDPDASCPQYDRFLGRVQPDDDMRAFLDAWGGYNMLGDAAAQKMALFYGQGANGKGVWINTVAALLGDYSWAAAIETFIDQGRYKKGGDASPDMAALVGRRMVYANEPEENSKFSDGLIKAMTSDEPIGGVRELHKPPFQLPVTFKNTVIANNKPRIGTDHGIQRRMQLVPWDVIIPEAERDLGLKAKLTAEGSGILNRLIRGALAYLTAGLPMPEAVREATREYIEENDILGQFIDLCLYNAPGETMGSSALHELFAAWQTWAQLLPATGKPWSPKHLSAQMEKRKYRKRKSSSMVWDGIGARFDPSDFTDEHGKPVVRDLPPPRGPSTSPPAPSNEWSDDDDYPV